MTTTDSSLPARPADNSEKLPAVLPDDLSELALTGVPGEAQPLDLRETGVFVDEKPVLEVVMSVRVGGRPPYPALYLGPIAEPALARAQDGRRFAARIDPHCPERVLVDWSGMCAA